MARCQERCLFHASRTPPRKMYRIMSEAYSGSSGGEAATAAVAAHSREEITLCNVPPVLPSFFVGAGTCFRYGMCSEEQTNGQTDRQIIRQTDGPMHVVYIFSRQTSQTLSTAASFAHACMYVPHICLLVSPPVTYFWVLVVNKYWVGNLATV